jgi:VWFA-related protein
LIKLCFAVSPTIAAYQSRQASPVFHTGTVIVPVDVRVLDTRGRPVVGLQPTDFTIREDGVVQEIQQFATITLAPSDMAGRQAEPGTARELGTQNRRVILLVLGRGKLQPVSKGVDALLSLVRDRLLVQDQVAVFAFNRATDFTNDHDYIASVLARFRDKHESIENQFRSAQDLATVYGVTSVAPSIQADIDEIFAVPGGPQLRTPPKATITDARRLAHDEREARDAMMAQMLAIERKQMLAEVNAPAASAGVRDVTQERMLEVGFGGFVAHFPQTLQDLTSIYQGIEYLRHVEGEKHLVFVTERGMFLPRLEDDTNVAAMASDARVAIDVIQTGGLPPAEPGRSFGFDAAFVARALRELSTLTGGLASVYSYASNAVDRLVVSTGSSYLLGYTPAETNWDGRYRHITVQINRRDVTLLYRHGYYARPPLESPDWRGALAYRRIVSAANFPTDVPDIVVTFGSREVGGATGSGLSVNVKIDPARLGWTRVDGDWLTDVDVAVFCTTRNGELVGDSRDHVNVRLPTAVMERARTSGLTFETRVPLRAAAERVKVVVYNYANDLVGTASGNIVR